MPAQSKSPNEINSTLQVHFVWCCSGLKRIDVLNKYYPQKDNSAKLEEIVFATKFDSEEQMYGLLIENDFNELLIEKLQSDKETVQSEKLEELCIKKIEEMLENEDFSNNKILMQFVFSDEGKSRCM
ncbi:MAG: hypothetical protein K6G65_04515 [Lachnospiraceae bacterium]|nr:hypothetical protein [Lachnospiraceae bacterium]